MTYLKPANLIQHLPNYTKAVVCTLILGFFCSQAVVSLPLPKVKPEVPTATAGFSSIAPTSSDAGIAATQPPSRTVSRSVVDQAGILNDEGEMRLTNALANFQAQRGIQIVVLTTSSLRGFEINKYSDAVSKQWNVAQTAEKPGVLVVVAPNEKFAKILVGPGLQEWMPNEVVDHILKSFMFPSFATSDWQTGIIRGSAGIISVLGREQPIQVANSAPVASEIAVADTSSNATQLPLTPIEASASTSSSSVQSNGLSMLIWPLLLLLMAMLALGLFWYRGRQVAVLADGSTT